MTANDDLNRHMLLKYLEQMVYWLTRFDISRDVDHLDNAERNAEVARLCLPPYLRELCFTRLSNIYWSLIDKTNPQLRFSA